MTPQASTHAPSDRSIETRTRILDAALSEFSAYGLAGARMDRIAGTAAVNKALLYYYYDSKESLYTAALEMIAGKIRDRSMAVFLSGAAPGERLLRTALDHFDRILAQQEFQSLMQQEMMRLHKGESDALPILVKRVFGPDARPCFRRRSAKASLGRTDRRGLVADSLAALGANVFYFLSAPIWRLVMPFEPFARDVLAARRKALVEFLGQAVFQDRQHGRRVGRARTCRHAHARIEE